MMGHRGCRLAVTYPEIAKMQTRAVIRAAINLSLIHIFLLHDCYASSVEAALRIVDILQKEGYEFVTVDRLLID